MRTTNRQNNLKNKCLPKSKQMKLNKESHVLEYVQIRVISQGLFHSAEHQSLVHTR